MAIKIKKSEIKQIVKECLVEILNEGIMSKSKKDLKESVILVDDENEEVPQNVYTRPSSPMSHKPMPTQQKRFAESVKNTVSALTSDPIMQSIFSDTASTTLLEQGNAEQNGKPMTPPIDAASRIVQNADPMDLFGGQAEKWADIAFAGGKK